MRRTMILGLCALSTVLGNIDGKAFYNPSTGKWPERDPIGEPGFTVAHERRNSQRKWTTNPYVFVENNPIIFIDPDALESVFIRLETEIRAPDPEPGTKTWPRPYPTSATTMSGCITPDIEGKSCPSVPE
jgi:RHS repeat-associated protein